MKSSPDLQHPYLGHGVKKGPSRLHEIDGIRGWAALSVLLYHMYIELFMKILPEANGLLPRFFIHGPLSVSIFFVLSGDALSSAYFSAGKSALDSMMVKRYLRLTVPILFSCAVVWLLLNLDLVRNREASIILNQEEWLGACLNFKPTLQSMIHYAVYGVYTNHTNTTSYNPFLWTMSVELLGSMLVFLYLYIHERLKQPKRVLAVLIAFTLMLKSFYCLFFLGILFCLLRQEGVFNRLGRHGKWQAVSVALLIICAWLDAWNVTGPNLGGHVNMILGPVTVFLFYSNNLFKKFFSSRLSIFLGDISFSLYLIHFSVIVSFTSLLVISQSDVVKHSVIIMLSIATASVALSVLAATIMWRLELKGLKQLARLPTLMLNRAR